MPILAYLNNLGMGGGGALIPAFDGFSQTPAGTLSSTAARRRRYIMPDGRVFLATTQEVVSLLRTYAVPASSAPAESLQKRDIRLVPAEDTLPGTYKAVLPERFTYRAPPEVYGHAETIANRMRADDEAILALIL